VDAPPLPPADPFDLRHALPAPPAPPLLGAGDALPAAAPLDAAVARVHARARGVSRRRLEGAAACALFPAPARSDRPSRGGRPGAPARSEVSDG
jgi:hypothetical protein